MCTGVHAGFECPVLVTLHLIALMQGLLLLNLVPMCFPVRLEASKARDPLVWTRRSWETDWSSYVSSKHSEPLSHFSSPTSPFVKLCVD